VVNSDGNQRKALWQGPGREDQPAWSHDGTKIAFAASTSKGNYDIFVMTADGKSSRNLTMSSLRKGLGSRMVSRRHKDRLCFLSEGNVNIFTMNVDGSGVQNITANGP
jgi:Tol biopolymer transport system component